MRGHKRKVRTPLKDIALAGGFLTELLLVYTVFSHIRAGGNTLYMRILFPLTIFILIFDIFLAAILFYIRRSQILEDRIRESESLHQILLSQKQSEVLLERDTQRLKSELMEALAEERKASGLCGAFPGDDGKQENQGLDPWDHRYCGNEMANAVFRLKSSQCEEKGIAVSIQAALPEKLALTDQDLCSLLTNLFDNAIEACGELPEQRRSIELQISRYKRYLLILMRNPATPGHVFRGPRQGHGLGMEIIKEIAEKYDGRLRSRFEEGRFQAEIVLKVL